MAEIVRQTCELNSKHFEEIKNILDVTIGRWWEEEVVDMNTDTK